MARHCDDWIVRVDLDQLFTVVRIDQNNAFHPNELIGPNVGGVMRGRSRLDLDANETLSR